MKINKYLLTIFLLLSLSGFVLFFWTRELPYDSNAANENADAISIRIVSNPNFLSPYDWYQNNNFTGNPQNIIVDGYDGILSGRTAYVGVADIDTDANKLLANIYIISYNQESVAATTDIFSQILHHWKFNTNVINIAGTCGDAGKSCLYDSDCGAEEFCTSQKSKIIRDVKRLAIIKNIYKKLSDYKKNNGNRYPDLLSGSYIPGISLSVWPSWQNLLGAKLGVNLPLDPVNKLGDCSVGTYNEKTCWSEKDKIFAGDLTVPQFPSDSHVLMYKADRDGKEVKVCSLFETAYANLSSYACQNISVQNNPPQIINMNLSGIPNSPFKGYALGMDPDGDDIKWEVDSSGTDWSGWSAAPIITKYIGENLNISAERSGNPGNYPIKITLVDKEGSFTEIIAQINISSYPMRLSSFIGTMIIGEEKSFTLVGNNTQNLPFNSLNPDSAFLDSALISMDDYGLSLSGMDLKINDINKQKTGHYLINIFALDAFSSNSKKSFFDISIKNHPPLKQGTKIIYANGLEEACCSFHIDNGENARIELHAVDPDSGHTVSYELKDNIGGKISIDQSSGIIAGLENLNKNELVDASFKIIAIAKDQYCANSRPEECSTEIKMDLTVDKYCSVDPPTTTASKHSLPSFPRIDSSGTALSIGDHLADCSVAGNSSIDVALFGVPQSKAIVFVLDLSSSMETLVLNETKAIDSMKDALTKTNGILDKLYALAVNLEAPDEIDVGLVGYNEETFTSSISNIVNEGVLANFKGKINNFSTAPETHTLKALNAAELMLDNVTDDIPKMIILMSDGNPLIDYQKMHYGCETPKCCGETPLEAPPGSDFNGGTCFALPSSETEENPDESEPATEPDLESDDYDDSSEFNEFCRPDRGWCFARGKCCDIASWDDCCYKTCEEQNPPLCPVGDVRIGCFPACNECGGCTGNCSNYTGVDRETCEYGYSGDGCQTPFECEERYVLPRSSYNSRGNFKIAITEQTLWVSGEDGPSTLECIAAAELEYIAAAETQGNSCSASSTSVLQSIDRSINKDISDDVTTQAESLKTSGVEIYGIYYNTSAAPEMSDKMCSWSSNNGIDCDQEKYFYDGADIDTMFDKVLQQIILKPKEIMLSSSVTITDSEENKINTPSATFNIDSALDCSSSPQEIPVTFSGDGYLEFSNLVFYTCPKKLHP